MVELREPDRETLEAVYNVNKHAKKYARLADENSPKGTKATARANSPRRLVRLGAQTALSARLVGRRCWRRFLSLQVRDRGRGLRR